MTTTATFHSIKLTAGTRVYPVAGRAVELEGDAWIDDARYFCGSFSYEVGGREYTVPENAVAVCEPPAVDQRPRMSEVFGMVEDATHWKNPIDATVLVGVATPEEIREAVIFFTGSVPAITRCQIPVRHRDGLVTMLGDAFEVKAAGYYAAIGA